MLLFIDLNASNSASRFFNLSRRRQEMFSAISPRFFSKEMYSVDFDFNSILTCCNSSFRLFSFLHNCIRSSSIDRSACNLDVRALACSVFSLFVDLSNSFTFPDVSASVGTFRSPLKFGFIIILQLLLNKFIIYSEISIKANTIIDLGGSW